MITVKHFTDYKMLFFIPVKHSKSHSSIHNDSFCAFNHFLTITQTFTLQQMHWCEVRVLPKDTSTDGAQTINLDD